jgi:hypothetical protein
MSNIIICHPNRLIEQNKLWSNASAWTTSLPVSNILSPVLQKKARTTSFATNLPAKAWLGISLQRTPDRYMGAISIINHNFSTSSKVKFTVYKHAPYFYSETTATISTSLTLSIPSSTVILAAGTSIRIYAHSSDPIVNDDFVLTGTIGSVALGATSISITNIVIPNGFVGKTFSKWFIGDSTAVRINNPKWNNIWTRVTETSSASSIWNSTTFWNGLIEEEQRNSYTKIHISQLYTVASTEQQAYGSHLHMELYDSASTYLEFGRLFIGQIVSPKVNPEYGAVEFGYIDNSEMQQSNSGTKYFYEKQKLRTVSLQWNHLDINDALGGIYDAYRSQGISREVLYLYSSDVNEPYAYAKSFLGRFTSLNAINQPNPGLYSASVNIEEIL